VTVGATARQTDPSSSAGANDVRSAIWCANALASSEVENGVLEPSAFPSGRVTDFWAQKSPVANGLTTLRRPYSML
jgi:hypothetical protein